MRRTDQLAVLRANVERVDDAIIELLAQRLELACAIEEEKRKTDANILCVHREHSELLRLEEVSRTLNLNPHFVTAVFYLLIRESAAAQLQQRQNVAAQR